VLNEASPIVLKIEFVVVIGTALFQCESSFWSNTGRILVKIVVKLAMTTAMPTTIAAAGPGLLRCGEWASIVDE
jgi:hypothetical protein